MQSVEPWVLPLTLLFALTGVAIVVLGRRRRILVQQRATKQIGATLEMECSECAHTLVIGESQLIPLSAVEKALAARTVNGIASRKPAEFVCPYCEAAHCFATAGGRLEWVGGNLYQPQRQAARCAECHVKLRRPAWPRAQYDGRLQALPERPDDLGLLCSRCDSVVCLTCCTNFTRRRTQDGALLCPRCGRGPVDRVFHH